MAKAFDLITKVRDKLDDSVISTDSSDEPQIKAKPKVELVFFFLLFFAACVIIGYKLLAPAVPDSTATNESSPTPTSSDQAASTGLTVEKTGTTPAEERQLLGLESTPTPTAAANATEKTSASEETTPAQGGQAKIQIQNGTGVSGAAEKLRQTLTKEGIAVASVGNYKNFSAKQTTIYYKSGWQTVATSIKKLIGGVLIATESGIGNYDILIVIGAKK